MSIPKPDPRDPAKWVKMRSIKPSYGGRSTHSVGVCKWKDCEEETPALRTEDATEQITTHVRQAHLGWPRMVPATHKYGNPPTEPYIAERQTYTFEVDVPTGKMSVTYAGPGHDSRYGARDTFVGRFRGEDVWGSTVAEMMGRVADVEAKHQAKAVGRKARAQAAKDPLPATLVHTGATKASGLFEDVMVRGIDQRNGAPLLIRKGENVTLDSRADSGSILCRELTDDEKVDIRQAWQAVQDAKAAGAAADAKGSYASRLVGPVPVRIVLDLDTFEKVQVDDDGNEVRRGQTDDDILGAILLQEVGRAGYRWTRSGGSPGGPVPWPHHDRPRGHDTVYRTREDVQAVIAAEAATAAAVTAAKAVVVDYRFDLSLFSGVADEPTTTDPERVPAVRRPADATDDWED